MLLILLGCAQPDEDCTPYDPGGGPIVCPGEWQICCDPGEPPDCVVVAPDGQRYARNQSAETQMYCEHCSMDSFSAGVLCGS